MNVLHTFLWDIPEFMPLPRQKGRFYVGPFYVGPLAWGKWPDGGTVPPTWKEPDRPLALVTFGTCQSDRSVVEKLTDCLLDQDYNVLISVTNQSNLMDIRPDHPRVYVWRFAPLH